MPAHKDGLMTVGELARRVGVTVRTIQYYDQKGLLHPSSKSEQNQRLYSTDDEERLYRILTLKFLGFSLTRSYLETWAKTFTTFPQGASAYLVIIGACVFVGLIICLNLVMHGLNYNKLKKLEQLSRKGKF